ncbi:MAG: Gfo/Idh/MocA family oxidoreductase [Lentisphaerae bacterium]|nr:Gfo/Idh/MocA family oxidoreductase [Lentisphaerota bacterium]
MTRDGMNYAPESAATETVVAPGEFVFAASHFDHGHIFGQAKGLAAAGGTLKYVYDADPARCEPLLKDFPDVKAVRDFREILDDDAVRLVTSAAVPNERCAIGLQVLDAGKDYFTDKCPFTTLAQLESARARVARTGRKYMVCYSERLLNEAAWYAGELIRRGAVGRVLQVLTLAPHNLAADTRPDWFFVKEQYGGIITDIGSHQFEKFLSYAGAADAAINFARVANMGNPGHPELEDFGEASLTLDTGASAYTRIDWFNPGGLRTWGDGRTFVIGTEGYLETRNYINVARDDGGNRIYLVDGKNEVEIECDGTVGFPFFGRLILDCLNRTENAMTQAHAFKAAELALKAQALAESQCGTAGTRPSA